MDRNNSLLEQLKDYICKATPEQLDKDWKELEEWDNVGPMADEYIESINKNL